MKLTNETVEDSRVIATYPDICGFECSSKSILIVSFKMGSRKSKLFNLLRYITIYCYKYAELIIILYRTIFIYDTSVSKACSFFPLLYATHSGRESPLSSQTLTAHKRKLVRSEEPLNNSCFMAAELHRNASARRIPAE